MHSLHYKSLGRQLWYMVEIETVVWTYVHAAFPAASGHMGLVGTRLASAQQRGCHPFLVNARWEGRGQRERKPKGHGPFNDFGRM